MADRKLTIKELQTKVERLEGEVKSETERCLYWEKQHKKAAEGERYYRQELAKAHEILGRVIHQLSERWDKVNITDYYPTNNLHGLRRVGNPSGKKEGGQ